MWVARDKNIKYCFDNETSFLWLYFGGKPIRNNKPYDPNLCDMDYTGCWLAQDDGLIIPLDNSLFPNLKWEDDPIEVGLYDDTLFKFISELITEYNDNVHLKYDYIKERFLNYISNEQSKSA